MKKKITWLLLPALLSLEPAAYSQLRPVLQPVRSVQTVSPVSLKLTKMTNAFSTSFNRNATGRNDMNAYLMCYITTLIYPQYLAIAAGNASDAYIDKLHDNRASNFLNEYKKQTSFLFGNADYTFVYESFPAGYDPEAMVISTSDAIYVVFRGTDRVSSNTNRKSPVSNFMYDWGEWLLSDFDAAQIAPVELTGKVHRGFWNSLSFADFKDDLLNLIKSKGGLSKKIWISGHSLGSAHAQIFAMYMAKKGVKAQGVYVYSAPHPGNREFVDELNSLYQGHRVQRFDFASDPITMLAPYSMGYQRAGTRVFYPDINTIQFAAPERSITEATAVVSSIVGLAANLSGKQFCYHHPTWLLRAAFTQLSASEREKVPAPLPIPDATTSNSYSVGCDALAINKGRKQTVPGSFIEQGIATVQAGLEQLKFAATSIIANVTGTAIAEGDYYIKSYASGGTLALNEMNGLQNGSSMKLTTAVSKVKIQRFGTVGYTIRFGTKNVNTMLGTEMKEYVLDSQAEDLYDDGATTIQLWEKNSLPAISANQRWLFIKLKDNKYLIKNIANGKLLDANNGCVNSNDCGVKTWDPVSDDQTQIWILEKS